MLKMCDRGDSFPSCTPSWFYESSEDCRGREGSWIRMERDKKVRSVFRYLYYLGSLFVA